MKILHTSDLHLQVYGNERWRVLEEMIAIARDTKVDVFVISGDLFDKNIDAENLKPKIRDVFSNNGFKVVLICGNHDQNSYKKGMYFGEDVIFLNDLTTPFEYQDVKVWGMPFEIMEREEILNKIRYLKKVIDPTKKNILLYHGELLDAFFSRRDFGDEGETRYMPVKLSYFNGLSLDYILAGHFHSRFDVRRLENGGYFVYPGSPVSITKKELGQRKVNIFEVGQPPKEYCLNAPHFEEVLVELDPFSDKKPIDLIEKCFKNVHSQAKIILTVKGFINGEKLGTSEVALVKQIQDIGKNKSIGDYTFEFKDVKSVLEDDLFKDFEIKIGQKNYDKEKRARLLSIAIKAMMESHI